MEIIKLNQHSQEKILSRAERILQSDGIIIAPTDTVYGILGNATDGAVIKKIFALKKRPQEKAFPIFVASITTARKYAYISDKKAEFLESVWPGPVTVIFQDKERLPQVLTSSRGTLGIRIPNHPLLLELLSRLEFPLAQTSANISTKPPARNLEEIKNYFEAEKTKPDLIIDGGAVTTKQSTVIDYTSPNPIVVRTGLMSKKEFDRTLGSM